MSPNPWPQALTPPLTHPRTARYHFSGFVCLAGCLSRGHPATWPLHFRDMTLCAELRGGTEGSMEASGGRRTSGQGLSRGGATSFVGPRPQRALPTILSPASGVTSPRDGP